MSTPKRAYDILRGYVGSEWDRLFGPKGVEPSASTELQNAMDQPWTYREPLVPSTPVKPFDPKVRARAILGVDESAEFAEIKLAFEKLNNRSDPRKFPKDSPEQFQASQIQKRVREAFRILSEGVDAVEQRFRSLELD